MDIDDAFLFVLLILLAMVVACAMVAKEVKYKKAIEKIRDEWKDSEVNKR